MALKIEATDEKQILIKGTAVQLNEVYARIETRSFRDGATMEVYLEYYATKEQYESNEPIAIDIPFKGFKIVDMLADEEQGINFAHVKAIAVFTENGYLATEV